MTTKHLRKKPIDDTPAKTKGLPSSIVEKVEGNEHGVVEDEGKLPKIIKTKRFALKPMLPDEASYQVLANTREDKMSDDEFNKAMAALEDIWNSCPKDLPKDLSKKHDQYLFGERK